MIVAGKEDGFKDSLEVGNLQYTFKDAQQKFNKWTEKQTQIGEFIKELPDNFFKLVDALTVARTRKMIDNIQDGLVFPKKEKPKNRYITPHKIGNYDSFEELFDKFPPMLSGYQPAFYVDTYEGKNVLEDERLRDRFLVKMMYILLVKRIESSWFSFQSTVEKVLEHHQNALDKIDFFERTKQTAEIEDDFDFADDDDLQNEFENENFELGKKRKIQISDIAAAGKLNAYKSDLKMDIEALDALSINLKRFADEIKREKSGKSVDDKLQDLIKQIKEKQASGENNANQKVVIFTTYTDTAKYLFEQLKKRGFNKIAFVSGSECATDDGYTDKKFEPILERFAPFTKLYSEKEWDFKGSYEEWKKWITENDTNTREKLNNPIDILIATDVLSEGQNLQDCDMVINYDIHWNPVRIIQRFGRIDRLGSPNTKIFSINYWASKNINNYLRLQSRIEDRMALMKLAGSEVQNEFSETFQQKVENEKLEQRQTEKMLRQMETTLEDIETKKSFGFDDLSLETFRQELLGELKEK
jgi:superfamily II DNA or RNA helicase